MNTLVNGVLQQSMHPPYARGATGKGIVIGITDSGLDTTHDETSSSQLRE